MHQEVETQNTSTTWKPGPAEWGIFICLAILSWVVALDTTIITPVIPILEKSLHGSATDAFWAGTAYLLASAVCQPLLVDLSDVFGRRQVLSFSICSFALGTLLACLAHNFGLLLTGRSFQGVGGGGIMALCIVINTDLVPLRQRPAYNAILQAAWAIGSLTGPVVGGAIAEHTTWRWIFYLNLPFCALGVVLVPMVVRLQAQRVSIRERIVHHVDWIGGFLFTASLCGFLIGITWGGNNFPWSSWHTLLPIIVGLAGIVAALLWERYKAVRPFFKVDLFNNRSAVAAYTGVCAQGALMLGLLYFLPLYLQGVKGLSAINSGLGLMIIIGALLPISIAAGLLISRLGRFRWAIWAGWALGTLATGLLVQFDQYTPTYHWALVFLVLGLGHGLILTSLNFCVQALSGDRQDGSAGGMYSFMRALGMCFGVAIAGTFFQNRLAARLRDHGLPGSISKDAAEFVLRLKSGSTVPYKEEAIGVFASSFQDLFILFTAISALAGMVSLIIRPAKSDRQLQSDHVLRTKN